VVTVESAAAAYVALVAPLNDRLEIIGQRASAAHTLEEARRISDAYARVHDDFAAALRAMEVPPAVEDEVTDAADAADQVAAVERRYSLADLTALRAVGDELTAALDDQRRVINRLRAALGIDSLGGAIVPRS
jgi:hypothetical protein